LRTKDKDGVAKDLLQMRSLVSAITSQMMDQVSASLTCLGKKKGSWRFRFPKLEMPSRPQEISLFSVTLGRNSILTWSHLMIKTPIAIAATAAVGLSFAQPVLRQSIGSPTSTR
jgi:hypothetical protein